MHNAKSSVSGWRLSYRNIGNRTYWTFCIVPTDGLLSSKWSEPLQCSCALLLSSLLYISVYLSEIQRKKMKTLPAIFCGAEILYSISPRSNVPEPNHMISYCSVCLCVCIWVWEHFGAICDLCCSRFSWQFPNLTLTLHLCLTQEKLMYFPVCVSNKKKSEDETEEGLGSLPRNVSSVSSLLLFNTTENLWVHIHAQIHKCLQMLTANTDYIEICSSCLSLCGFLKI